ncbi:hypothetical protein Bpfe_030192 [Biomphalaria pfeifferi]|uniref:Uncharacterized protein n=1 Tax=Biomphalaria pfeifferi TaxID=112525 RepID=A0AAD8EUZ5_BIOPF|nr:hypothetical protein Bpfe_030192 [Biomphalaria pfeifferi]
MQPTAPPQVSASTTQKLDFPVPPCALLEATEPVPNAPDPLDLVCPREQLDSIMAIGNLVIKKKQRGHRSDGEQGTH